MIQTRRLLLRTWCDDDLPAFAAMNSDPQVMKHLPRCLTVDESNDLASRIRSHFSEHGFGLWAVEIPGVARFAGFTGLSVPTFESRFTPCVEVGWRLGHAYWNHGYATEAARAAVNYGFETHGLHEIVSFTVPHNTASRRVMEKLGMTHDPADDFDHPLLPHASPLRRHVLYRLLPSN